MARSEAATVDEYLDELPDDCRETLAAVREVILRSLPEGYREAMNWGMISYEIPLERYPDTYNGQPLGYVALASQKNYCALYLHAVYMDPVQRERLERAFARAGKKMDMGKSCLRFRSPDDLPLEALGELVASAPPDAVIQTYEAAQRR